MVACKLLFFVGFIISMPPPLSLFFSLVVFSWNKSEESCPWTCKKCRTKNLLVWNRVSHWLLFRLSISHLIPPDCVSMRPAPQFIHSVVYQAPTQTSVLGPLSWPSYILIYQIQVAVIAPQVRLVGTSRSQNCLCCWTDSLCKLTIPWRTELGKRASENSRK